MCIDNINHLGAVYLSFITVLCKEVSRQVCIVKEERPKSKRYQTIFDVTRHLLLKEHQF